VGKIYERKLLTKARSMMAVDERDGVLFLRFFLQVDGWAETLKLTVPPMPPYLRKRGRQFIKSLGAVAR
jgi:hypothetical protein